MKQIACVRFAPAADAAASEELVERAEAYLVALLRNGQIIGDYLLGLDAGVLTAYVGLAGADALAPRAYSRWAAEELQRLVEQAGAEPAWTLLGDTPPEDASWQGAPSLYIQTSLFEHGSPVHHGGTGAAVPLYRLPLPDLERDRLGLWAGEYRHHEGIWLASADLEMPAYEQLVDPKSGLAAEGRRMCAQIEAATGVPTYYFLIRYWGRRTGEEQRVCPGCGQTWATGLTWRAHAWWEFAFRCEACRLVSHEASTSEDERRARRGEYRR